MREFLIVLSITFVGTQVLAQLPKKALQTPQLVAIQNKANYLDHDLSLEFGVLPSDAFNKGVTLGGSYTYFYSQYSAWEIINLKGSINFETSLKQDLLDVGVDVTNTTLEGKLDPISFIITSNYVYTPFYSKSLLFNSSILNSETSFVAGIGTIKFKTTGFQPLVNIGAYARYYTDLGKSWKFDLRWNFHSDSSGSLGNFIFIGASYSMQLGDVPEHLKTKKRFE